VRARSDVIVTAATTVLRPLPFPASLYFAFKQSLDEIGEAGFAARRFVGECWPVDGNPLKVQAAAERGDAFVLQVHALTCNRAS